MKEKIIYEMEMNVPQDWVSNVIFERDGKGNIIELEIPDDKEE